MKDPRLVVRQAAKLVRTSRAAGHRYGSSRVRAALTARRLRRRQAYEYDEALVAGLLDPAMPERERALYVSQHAQLKALGPLNHGSVPPNLSSDKSVFYRYCRAYGIATPDLYGILDRRGSSWSTAGRFFRDVRGFEEFVEQDLPGEFIVKPSRGAQGEGVRLLVKNGGDLVDFSGARLSAGSLWKELVADPEHDEWIVQQRKHNHEDLVALAGDRSLHGVRIATLVDAGGRAEVVMAFLKLALGGGISDNFLGGSTGNAVAQVSVSDGRLGPLLTPAPGGIGFRSATHSPLTGAQVEGARLPHWERACRLVLDAAPHFLPTRSLGWDVALTPEGPVVLEANTRWLVMPMPSMKPAHDRIRAEVDR